MTLSYTLLNITCIVIIIVFLKWSAPFLSPILFAFTLSLLIWPAIRWLKNKGLPRGLAITVIAIAVLIAISLLIGIISLSITQLIEKLPYYEESLTKQLIPLQNTMKNWGISLEGLKLLEGINGSQIARAVLNFVGAVIANISNVFFFLLLLLFMIVASDGIIAKFTKHFSSKHSFASNFVSWSKNVQQQYRVQTTDNLISAGSATLIFFILGIDFAILWGFFTFILAYIPNIGIILAGIPPVIIAFILYGPWHALLVIILLSALNLLMDNVITPKFMGEELKIPAIFVFLSFIFWTWVFGPLGAFISLPITLGLRSLLLFNPKAAFIADILTGEEEKPDKKTKKKNK
jgi:predicted PurR-regulated permease PerM